MIDTESGVVVALRWPPLPDRRSFPEVPVGGILSWGNWSASLRSVLVIWPPSGLAVMATTYHCDKFVIHDVTDEADDCRADRAVGEGGYGERVKHPIVWAA